MKLYQLCVIIVAVAVITLGITAIAFSNYKVLDEWAIPYNLTVISSGIGFITDVSIPLQFGEAHPGATIERFIDIGNSKPYPINVKLSGKGETANWIMKRKEHRIIYPGETFKKSVKLQIPDDAEHRDYNGVLIVTTYRS